MAQKIAPRRMNCDDVHDTTSYQSRKATFIQNLHPKDAHSTNAFTGLPIVGNPEKLSHYCKMNPREVPNKFSFDRPCDMSQQNRFANEKDYAISRSLDHLGNSLKSLCMSEKVKNSYTDNSINLDYLRNSNLENNRRKKPS